MVCECVALYLHMYLRAMCALIAAEEIRPVAKLATKQTREDAQIDSLWRIRKVSESISPIPRIDPPLPPPAEKKIADLFVKLPNLQHILLNLAPTHEIQKVLNIMTKHLNLLEVQDDPPSLV